MIIQTLCFTASMSNDYYRDQGKMQVNAVTFYT